MAYELRFASLLNTGRGFAFPCDCTGHVDMDAIPERARINYLYARAQVGHELTIPVVVQPYESELKS